MKVSCLQSLRPASPDNDCRAVRLAASQLGTAGKCSHRNTHNQVGLVYDTIGRHYRSPHRMRHLVG